MSSFSRILGGIALAVVLVVPLAACTGIRPVYSDAGLGAKRFDVAYAPPGNKLERLIYQDLALRLGKAEGAVPQVRISAWPSNVNLTQNTITSPTTAKQASVTAVVTVTAPDGTVLFSGTRSQTADFTTDPQAMSNQAAIDAAERRAALLLADTLRLQIIAALAPK
jgi:hypothetical protein